jgi:hypothetical protein
MAGLVPAIHVFVYCIEKTWMPGIKPGMTSERIPQCPSNSPKNNA